MAKFTLEQQSRRLNVHMVDRRQVFGVGLRLAQYGGHLHFHDFV
jgi:hypothetical protein